MQLCIQGRRGADTCPSSRPQQRELVSKHPNVSSIAPCMDHLSQPSGFGHPGPDLSPLFPETWLGAGPDSEEEPPLNPNWVAVVMSSFTALFPKKGKEDLLYQGLDVSSSK